MLLMRNPQFHHTELNQMFRAHGMTEMTIVPFGSTAAANRVANERLLDLTG
jgi:hypothetical protein